MLRVLCKNGTYLRCTRDENVMTPAQSWRTPCTDISGRILNVDLTQWSGARSRRLTKHLPKPIWEAMALPSACSTSVWPPGIDPLSPENMLVFAVGPATDTPIPGATRCFVGTKSPLTGLFLIVPLVACSLAMQKRAGFEAITITGQAPQPVYLLVHEDGAEIKPATDVWGQYTRKLTTPSATANGGGGSALHRPGWRTSGALCLRRAHLG